VDLIDKDDKVETGCDAIDGGRGGLARVYRVAARAERADKMDAIFFGSSAPGNHLLPRRGKARGNRNIPIKAMQ